MAESFEAVPPSKSAEAMPAVPPSTSEITVRTLQSDVELMTKSGGMTGQGMPGGSLTLPQIEHVPLSSAPDGPIGPTGVAEPHPTPAPKNGTEKIIWIGIIVLVAGILFAVGFYFAPLFLGA